MRRTLFICLSVCAVALCHAQSYDVGTTTAIWKNPSSNDFKEASDCGVKYIEVAFNQCYRNVPADEVILRIKRMKEIVDSSGVKVWSIHLPFSRTLDISVLDDSLREANVKFMISMIEQCGQFSPRCLVLHPSSEPIYDDARAARILNAKASIARLKPYVDRIWAVLCVENLPRTCLGNTPEELFELIKDVEGVKVCFDTNHYFRGTPEHFLQILGSRIGTIHVSDYDLVNECHWLPSQGKTDWNVFIKKLRECGYDGVFMYEATKDRSNNNVKPTAKRIVETFCEIMK